LDLSVDEAAPVTRQVSAEIDWLARERVPEVQRFIEEHWRRGHALARDEELLRWQHRSLADPGRLSILVADQAGELVAMLGLVEFEACLGERRGRGAWMTNWLVVPERRGEGIGAALVERARSEYAFVGALDANEATRRALAGSFVERPILRWALVYDPDAARALLGREPEWIDAAAAVAAGALFGACRDAEFLAWRYRAHPRFEYTVLNRDSELSAYRLAGRVLRVVDFLGDEELAQEVAEAGRATGAAFAEFSCASAGYAAPLEAAGFRRASGLPSRFQPLDLGERPDVSCFWAPGLPLGNLYVTAADGDLDRPNE
jgi:GNAT superfamily N-acetyltransferase